MSKVAIALDKNKLKNYLLNSTENFKYIFAGNKDTDLVDILSDERFSEIVEEECSESYKEDFCKLYIDFVGSLGLQFNSVYWWATFTSSKNRFISKLFPKLFSLNSIVNKLEKYKNNAILIINPDESVCRALKKFLKSQNREFICFEDKIKRVFARLIWCIESLIRRVAVIYGLCKKRYITHRYLQRHLKAKIKKGGAYYVIKTFIYQRSFDSNSNYFDSFFGVLPRYLTDHGKGVIILGYVFGEYAKIVKTISRCKSFTIIPPEYLISYLDIIKLGFHFFGSKIRIREKIDFLGLDVSDIVSSEIERDYSDGSTLYQYAHYLYIKNLLKAIKIHTFILTYENNPWERMCTRALRQYSPSTKIIGYQHTVVPQASANMFLSEYDRDVAPLPDKILTVGIVTKRIMEHYGYYGNIPIEDACALRYEYLFNLDISPRSRRGRILVALDGVHEVCKLVNYVLQECKDVKDFEIKIRDHPAVPFCCFRNKVKYDIEALPHISLSKSVSVKDDIQWSDMVIYWGSTVALEALMIGKPIIHFDTRSGLSYDPLFENKDLKWTVTENDRLREIIEQIYTMSDETFYWQQRKAREYLEKYFYPVSEKGLQKFLN